MGVSQRGAEFLSLKLASLGVYILLWAEPSPESHLGNCSPNLGSVRPGGAWGWPALVCACADSRDRVCSSSPNLVLADRVHLSPPEFPLQAPTHSRQRLPSVVSARGPGLPTQDSAVMPTLPQTALETLASALPSPSRPHSPHSCLRPRALLSFAAEHVQVAEEAGGGEQGEEPAGSGHE